MRILGIDPATRTGWCVVDGDFVASGTWDLSVRRDESSGMRLIRLRAKLNEIQKEKNVDVLVFEANRHVIGRRSGATVGAELQGVIKLWAIDNMVQFKGYSPSEIKKHATGKGNCNKNAMMVAAHNRWPEVHRMGPAYWTSDEADARWLADLAAEHLSPVSGEGDIKTGDSQ